MRKSLIATLTAIIATAIGGTAGAQVTPTVTVDQPQYTPGQTVTFHGAGWDACTRIAVQLLTPDHNTVLRVGWLYDPVNGAFSDSFPAEDPLGTWTLRASGDQEGCDVSTTFEVVAATTTTTTTGAPTTASSPSTTTTAIGAGGPTTAAPSLPATGSALGDWLVAAITMTVLGVLAALTSRRRVKATTEPIEA